MSIRALFCPKFALVSDPKLADGRLGEIREMLQLFFTVRKIASLPFQAPLGGKEAAELCLAELCTDTPIHHRSTWHKLSTVPRRQWHAYRKTDKRNSPWRAG
mmetsp:Transcript_42582/g.74852  ORF Transcript_42582/g.74852 Transcript_42582/m.74852 type:complete len:102 (+) Transcript_42582:489-794(+)